MGICILYFFCIFIFFNIFFIYIAGHGSKSSSDPLVPTYSIARLNATERPVGASGVLPGPCPSCAFRVFGTCLLPAFSNVFSNAAPLRAFRAYARPNCPRNCASKRQQYASRFSGIGTPLSPGELSEGRSARRPPFTDPCARPAPIPVRSALIISYYVGRKDQ